MASDRRPKFRNKTVNVQPWFCDDCAKYGAVGLVTRADGGSESPVPAIQASHLALSPDCGGRRLVICALQTLDLTD